MAGDLILVVEDDERSLKLFRDVLQALRRLRADERTASIPVPAVTAQAMRGDRRRFLGAGFDTYLSKPVNIGELVSMVEQHCRGSGR